MRFLLAVTLISFFQVVVAAVAETSSSGGLVDIGGGRKIYLECRGTGFSYSGAYIGNAGR